MGLAVLPSRLVEELDAVADAIIKGLDMAKNEKLPLIKLGQKRLETILKLVTSM